MNDNPLLRPSTLPYGAPEFDKIKLEHYMPAFKQCIEKGKKDIDAIVGNPEAPTFDNTILALEYAGEEYSNACAIFYNLLEADTNDEMQRIAEDLSPLSTEYALYTSLNKPLFERIKSVYEKRDSLGLEKDQMRLLVQTYKGFEKSGCNLPEKKKKRLAENAKKLSLLTLQYEKNVLDATNAFELHLCRKSELAGLPEFVKDMAESAAREKGLDGWLITLKGPCSRQFLRYSTRRDLRKKVSLASMSVGTTEPYSNLRLCKDIVSIKMANAQLLGYRDIATSALEFKMAKNPRTVNQFLENLADKTMPYAKAEEDRFDEFALENGYSKRKLKPWDMAFLSEKYRQSLFDLNDEMLKPYFKLENCIDAVFDLACRLYDIRFEERKDLPVYHKDVKVYDVKDNRTDKHLALFYADFFPRDGKHSGAWMTEFSGQRIKNGVEERPIVSIVTNFTKPTLSSPSLITHGELTTFLHEFGHALHGIFAQGRYCSLTGTNVARDFVELPSQIMENWAFEKEFLKSFAKHYKTGETIPDELIDKIIASQNFGSGGAQLGQTRYAILDMAWHTMKKMTKRDPIAFENRVLKKYRVRKPYPGVCISTAFSHIFGGGYTAGYYSYKWAEVLEADAFSLFKEKGIFSKEVAGAFRKEILERGDQEDADILYRNFRGRDPQVDALMTKLGLTGDPILKR